MTSSYDTGSPTPHYGVPGNPTPVCSIPEPTFQVARVPDKPGFVEASWYLYVNRAVFSHRSEGQEAASSIGSFMLSTVRTRYRSRAAEALMGEVPAWDPAVIDQLVFRQGEGKRLKTRPGRMAETFLVRQSVVVPFLPEAPAIFQWYGATGHRQHDVWAREWARVLYPGLDAVMGWEKGRRVS